MPDTDRSTPRRKDRKWMPRMQGAAVQCCMCIVGVFLFLGGLIMLVTGVCLILNYGAFDEDLLPPDLQNDEGKKTVGIILTCCGLFAILISVVASALYLCTKSKPSSINPNELSRIPNTARNTPPDRRGDRRSIGSINGNLRTQPGKPRTQPTAVRTQQNTKSIPGSTEVIHARQPAHRKGRPRKMKHRGRRLEEIKEQDAISRKTVEGAILADNYDDNLTPRSGSFSSQFTLDESKNPRIVIGTEEQIRPPSTDSASTSQLSDISNFRTLENDKSRRELQFLPDSVKYSGSQYDTVSKDSISLTKDTEVTAYRRDSEEGSIGSERNTDKHQMSTSSFNSFNDKFSAGGNDFTAQGRLPDVSSSDESSIGYKSSNYPDFPPSDNKHSGVVNTQSSDIDNNTRTEIKPFNVQKDNASQSYAENSDHLATASEVTLISSYKKGVVNEGFDEKPNDDSFV